MVETEIAFDPSMALVHATPDWGWRLALARTNAGVSRRRLADEIGCGRTKLARVEAGESELPASGAVSVAARLHIDLLWLLTGCSRRYWAGRYRREEARRRREARKSDDW